jgi:hypothetical protein
MMRYWRGWPIPQPTLFFDRALFERYGPLDESYRLALDYEWLVRVGQHIEFTCLPETLATYRLHGAAKTGEWRANKSRFFVENLRANRRHAPLHAPRAWRLWLAYARYRLGLERPSR